MPEQSAPEAEHQPAERHTGSPQPGEPVYLVIGKLRRPHGVRGELLMDVLSDFPDRIQPGTVVFVGHTYTPLRIRSRRPHGAGLLIAFEGYHNPEAVGDLRNTLVFVKASDRPPLPDGEYYHHALLGLSVVDTSTHATVGVLVEILYTGANDVFVVQPDQGPEILLPAIESVIQEIDLQAREIRVKMIPGLYPD
jgi:16S rRNA processing protein RimM